MSTIKISDTLGNVHQFPFATSLSQLPYSNKIDFDVACEDIALWAHASKDKQDNENDFLNNDAYYCYLLCRAVSKYTGYDLKKIMKFNTSDMVDSHGNFLPFVEKEEKPEFEIDLEIAEQTLNGLYNAAKGVIDSYEFIYRNDDNFLFKYADQQWAIPRVVKSLFDGRKVFSKFNTAQAVETMMIRNFLDEKVNNKSREKVSAEDVANLRYSAHLNLISISVTSVESELVDGRFSFTENPLPFDSTEFDCEVAERVALFAGDDTRPEIDSQTALDIFFFLMRTTSNSEMSQKIIITSMPHLEKDQMK